MHNAFRRSSYPQLWTGDFQTSETWRKDQYKGKYITVFQIFTLLKFYNSLFLEFLLKMRKNSIFQLSDSITLEQSHNLRAVTPNPLKYP